MTYVIEREHTPKNIGLVCVHGGGWVRGSPYNKNFEGIEDLRYNVYAPEYTLATPEKRSYPGVMWDIQRAMIYAAQRNEEVYLLGTSAGATLALLTAIRYIRIDYPVKPSGLILMYGFYDFEDTSSLSPEVEDMFYTFIGNKSAAAKANPMNELDIIKDLPVLLVHGTRDTVINSSEADKFIKNRPDTYYRIMDSGHGIPVREIKADLALFIER